MRMLNIFPTVKVFSNLDLNTGKKFSQPLLYRPSQIKQIDDKVDFGNNVFFNIKTGILFLGEKQEKVNQVVITNYSPDNKLRVQRNKVHSDGKYIILTLKNYDRVLIMDKEMYDSTYIQMFFLENYDENYFEPVIISPWSKVYRIKV